MLLVYNFTIAGHLLESTDQIVKLYFNWLNMWYMTVAISHVEYNFIKDGQYCDVNFFSLKKLFLDQKELLKMIHFVNIVIPLRMCSNTRESHSAHCNRGYNWIWYLFILWVDFRLTKNQFYYFISDYSYIAFYLQFCIWAYSKFIQFLMYRV